jgi:hypothetical protein
MKLCLPDIQKGNAFIRLIDQELSRARSALCSIDIAGQEKMKIWLLDLLHYFTSCHSFSQ